MNLRLTHDQLTARIRSFAEAARDARQIASRLRQLMPDRFQALSRKPSGDVKDSVAHRQRKALASSSFAHLVGELVDTNAQAREARIQYETHMMLIDARRTLRGFRQ
jgi:hypothetical protein